MFRYIQVRYKLSLLYMDIISKDVSKSWMVLYVAQFYGKKGVGIIPNLTCLGSCMQTLK